MNRIVETTNLGCKVGYRYLLKDINWNVDQGDHWVVFGMNGCGKTTLLSSIAGFRHHTHGSLKVFGQSYSEENVLAMRKKIGFISSSFFDKILSRESALDIVLSGKFGTVGIDGYITNNDVMRAKLLLKELRVGDKTNYPFSFLSKGERQNVLIARAMMGNPELLILDEPGTGLDVFAREYMLSTVKDFAENTNCTIIYVTHYTEEILRDFDKCMLMQNGRIYQIGETAQLFSSDNISALLDYPVDILDLGDRMQVRLSVQSHIQELLG